MGVKSLYLQKPVYNQKHPTPTLTLPLNGEGIEHREFPN